MSSGAATIQIGPLSVGGGNPSVLVAEVGQAHDGSLGLAHAYIDAVAESGFDAVKFQAHIAGEESTLDEPFRVRFSEQDATRFDYWKRMEFTPEQWDGLARHASEKKLMFLCSAFSPAAVFMLDRIGMPAWKIGSGEFRSWDLLEPMAKTGKPVIYSTGMSTYGEIAEVAGWLESRKLLYALLHCVSKYPTPLEECGLNVIDELRERHSCPVGLSDHSGDIHPGLLAMARGCDLLEVHVVFDRAMFGPDVPVSLTPGQLAGLAQARDAFALMDASPVDKDAMVESLSGMRSLFTKSIAPARDLKAGETIGPGDLTLKKPGTGIPASRLEALIGARLARDVSRDRLLREDDLEKQAAREKQ